MQRAICFGFLKECVGGMGYPVRDGTCTSINSFLLSFLNCFFVDLLTHRDPSPCRGRKDICREQVSMQHSLF